MFRTVYFLYLCSLHLGIDIPFPLSKEQEEKEQALAELNYASVKLEVIVEVIVSLLFWVGDGWVGGQIKRN